MDESNLQYYDPMPPQAPKPWWQERKFLLTAGIIVGSVVVLGLLAVFLINTVFLNKEGSKRAEELSQVQAVANQLAADCDPGDMDCRARAQANAAREVGVVEACKDSSDALYAGCVTLIALDAADPSLCASLSGEDKDKCEDAANLKKAKNEDDVSVCSKLHSSLLQVSCNAQLGEENAELKAAVATGDPDQCEGLSVDEEANCRDILQDTDSDGDGLNDAAETEDYHTDPHRADTDGDGYNDGTEVESGYDPLS